ncbi:hypothetical protein TNCV_426621 [Trichonephila clavipes]|nr:hypothetical protein TNCV_426621 [Trichonephila clavipes]
MAANQVTSLLVRSLTSFNLGATEEGSLTFVLVPCPRVGMEGKPLEKLNTPQTPYVILSAMQPHFPRRYVYVMY